MSRNLTRRNCARCEGDVKIVGPIADITREQARSYFDEYQGMKVADADCATCGARYLAWCAAPPSWPRWEWYTPSEGGFFDLSYRSTFNDEPGSEDLPVRTEKLRSRICDLRVKSINRRSIVNYAELTIEAACLDSSPNLQAMRVRIESANEMEALLRTAAYETQPNGVCGDIHCTGTFREDLLALLARIDAAAEPRQPR